MYDFLVGTIPSSVINIFDSRLILWTMSCSHLSFRSHYHHNRHTPSFAFGCNKRRDIHRTSQHSRTLQLIKSNMERIRAEFVHNPADGIIAPDDDAGGVVVIAEEAEGDDDDLIVDPLSKYLTGDDDDRRLQQRRTTTAPFDVDVAIEDLMTMGYHVVPSVLTRDECDEALGRMWDFVEDVSGGCVGRCDPTSWYPRREVRVVVETAEPRGGGRRTASSAYDTTAGSSGGGDDVDRDRFDDATNAIADDRDLDPWPHTGYRSFPDMFQSLGAGYLMGRVRHLLAERIFEPLFGTRELLCSKEGFSFCRPLIVDLDGNGRQRDADDGKNILVWTPNNLDSFAGDSTSAGSNATKDARCSLTNMERRRNLFRVCGKPQPLSEGQHYDQGVPIAAVRRIRDTHLHDQRTAEEISKKQQQRSQRKLNKNKRLKDLAGLCSIQASISFIDQTLDKDRGGGHFLCYPHSHSDVHWKLVGGTYRATSTNERDDPTWVPLTDQEIRRLAELGCPEKRIHANVGDVILWRSDLVHAGVAPSLIIRRNDKNGIDEFLGPKEFRAVAYCSMLPVQAVNDYTMFSLPKQKLIQGRCKLGLPRLSANNAPSLDPERTYQLLKAKEDALIRQKLESYKTGRTGDHRPEIEQWHEHKRVTMWNLSDGHHREHVPFNQFQPFPPRLLQRPRYRLGAPSISFREAELYGLIPYRRHTDDAFLDEKMRHEDIERAVIRGVRFVECLYKGRQLCGKEVGSWKMINGKFDSGEVATAKGPNIEIPICSATMEVLTPRSVDGAAIFLSGQDKYLGGMASPCGRYIYGVPVSIIGVLRSLTILSYQLISCYSYPPRDMPNVL